MNDNDKPSILDTIDTYIAHAPLGDNMAALFYRRQHSGKEYIRWRIWHRQPGTERPHS